MTTSACSGRTTTVTFPEGVRPFGRPASTVAPLGRRIVAPVALRGDRVAFEEIGLADEIGDEAFGRAVIDFARASDLQDLALGHDRDAVRHGERFFLVMRHEDEGDAGLVLEALQLDLHLLAQFIVERR